MSGVLRNQLLRIFEKMNQTIMDMDVFNLWKIVSKKCLRDKNKTSLISRFLNIKQI